MAKKILTFILLSLLTILSIFWAYLVFDDFKASKINNNIGPYISPTITPTSTPGPTFIYDPPIEVILFSFDGSKYVLAADTISYLFDYERYSVRDNNDPNLRKIFDQGYAYYLNNNTHVLLLGTRDGLAQVQLLEPHWDKKIGDIGWLRSKVIKEYLRK